MKLPNSNTTSLKYFSKFVVFEKMMTEFFKNLSDKERSASISSSFLDQLMQVVF